MDDLPTLRTPRLTLRVPRPADAAAMVRFVTDNREWFGPWEPTPPVDYFTGGYWQVRLAREADASRDGLGLALALFDRNDPGGPILGRCALSQVVRGPFQAAYLGFGIDREHGGRGLMSEALRALVAHAFGPMHLHRLMAAYVPGNERSERLLARLGFEREGVARDYLRLDGRWRDHVLTALTNDGWVAKPGAGRC